MNSIVYLYLVKDIEIDNLPNWLSFNKDTYTITGIPDNDNVAQYNLNIDYLGFSDNIKQETYHNYNIISNSSY